MSKLTDFLLARIAEDEAAAAHRASELNAGVDIGCGASSKVVYIETAPERWTGQDGMWGTLRVQAECEAKRALLHLSEQGCGDDYERVQKALALPYANHPEYRPEWRL